MFQFDSLSIQIGPVAGHASGPLAMALMAVVVAVYILGPTVVTELFRGMLKRRE